MARNSPQATSRFRALAELLRPDARRWAGLGMLVTFTSALTLAGPLVVRKIVDLATTGTTAVALTRLAFVFLFIAIATQILSVVVSWFATVSAWHTTNQIRLDMARHVLGLDHEFHRTHTPGELIQRVDGDVTSVSDFLGKVVPRAVGAVVLVFGMIVVLLFVDWRLAAGMAIYMLAAGAVVVHSRHRAVGESAEEMGAYARLYGGIEERLTASEDLRSNGAGAHAMWRFVEDSAAAMKSAVKRERAFLRMWWAVQTSVATGAALSLALSAALVAAGVISVGTAFLLFQYLLLLERPLEDLVQQLETVQKANGAMVRVIDLLAVEATILDTGTTTPPAGALAISFDHVSFDYGDGDPVLSDVDAVIAAGRSVGIVGRTGSGKTTLSRLLLRLVEAASGTVVLNGVPIADIPMDVLRRRVALIPQEVELVAGSIRDNVTLFDPAPSDEAVCTALRLAGLAPLADGDIHRPLGSGGAGLSAGEAQLLALARVWLRDPDLVVLDEATARVDPVTEVRLETAVRQLMSGRTTVIIAHRLSTLRHVDEIIVMEHGRIVEHGDRATLTGLDGGRFRRLLSLALDTDETPDLETPDLETPALEIPDLEIPEIHEPTVTP